MLRSVTLSLFLIGAINPAWGTLLDSTALANPGFHKVTTSKIQTATKKESGRPVVRLPPKVKLLRSNPHRFIAIRFQDVDPADAPDDEGLALQRQRRLEIITDREWDPDLDISDHAKLRLAIARALALAKYREKWT